LSDEDLGRYDGPDQVISAAEMATRLSAQSESIFNLKSFMPSLDRAVDGFREGELVVISGSTKHGKTLLAQSLSQAFCRQQVYPLWFSFEVPARQFLAQFHELPMIFMPAKLRASAVDWFEDRALESFLKYHTRIIFIDHLHYLVDLGRIRNPSLEIGQVIRKLKLIAVERGFLIFLLCHTTKGSSVEGELSFESIRDSSFVSQESDSVFMIKRTPQHGPNAARLRIEFHRRTGVLEQVVYLVKVEDKLVEASPIDETNKPWKGTQDD